MLADVTVGSGRDGLDPDEVGGACNHRRSVGSARCASPGRQMDSPAWPNGYHRPAPPVAQRAVARSRHPVGHLRQTGVEAHRAGEARSAHTRIGPADEGKYEAIKPARTPTGKSSRPQMALSPRGVQLPGAPCRRGPPRSAPESVCRLVSDRWRSPCSRPCLAPVFRFGAAAGFHLVADDVRQCRLHHRMGRIGLLPRPVLERRAGTHAARPGNDRRFPPLEVTRMPSYRRPTYKGVVGDLSGPLFG